MKKVNLLSKAEMKKVMGGNLPVSTCVTNAPGCLFDGPGGELLEGDCEKMENEQCRCVAYRNGSPYQSVPHNGCKV